jgi:hypothetical protein
MRNLCWTNKTRKAVINKWQDTLKVCDPIILSWEQFYRTKPETDHQEGQTDELVVMAGLTFIATRSVKELSVGNNEEFVVMTCGGGVGLMGEHTELELTDQEFYELFYSAICITIHKSQGDTYDDQYTIHDWDRLSEDGPLKRRLRYVSQSRSKDEVVPSRKIYYK